MMISRIVVVLLSWPATSAGKQLAWSRQPTDTPRHRAARPLLPNPELCNGKSSGQATLVLIYYPRKRCLGKAARHTNRLLRAYLICARRISSTRDCHPEPEARKAFTTSGESRIETGTFLGARCWPRLLGRAACNAGGKPLNGTACAKSARVHSGLSRSTVGLGALFVLVFFMPCRLP